MRCFDRLHQHAGQSYLLWVPHRLHRHWLHSLHRQRDLLRRYGAAAAEPYRFSVSDINECAVGNGGCDPLTVCSNLPGSRACSGCPRGYTGRGDQRCVGALECCSHLSLNRCAFIGPDIDECVTDNGGCDWLTVCNNTAGNRTCSVCPSGYRGDGYRGCVGAQRSARQLCFAALIAALIAACITDIDECQSNNGGCDSLMSCKNTPGSRLCGPCPSGYSDRNTGIHCYGEALPAACLNLTCDVSLRH